MKRTIQALQAMQRAICRWKETGPDSSCLVDVQKYVKSIDWKTRFLHHHCDLLSDVRWDDLSGLSNPKEEDAKDAVEIRFGNRREGHLIRVRTGETGRLLMLIAFDGVVAACVNAADTFGHLLNLVYKLGFEEFEANLPKVAKEIPLGSPLGVVLHEEPGIDAVSILRKLRGECQHADISEVMLEGYGGGIEPMVNRKWCPGATDNIRVSDYTASAKARTLQLLSNAAAAVADAPEAATAPRS